MFNKAEFAIKLRTLRIKNKLTQKQLAEYLQISRSTYSYYEIGKTEPPISSLVLLAASALRLQ